MIAGGENGGFAHDNGDSRPRPRIEGGRTHFGKVRGPKPVDDLHAVQPERRAAAEKSGSAGGAWLAAVLASVVLIGLWALAGGAGV